ncbi:MAG: bifunctional riboflavin kinase/FAD synthetase [Phormidesmis sp.]
MWITSSLQAAKGPTNIALGNFDGVHLGHQQVMAEVLRELPTATSVTNAFSNQAVVALHNGDRTAGHSQFADSQVADSQVADSQVADGQHTVNTAEQSLLKTPIDVELPPSGVYSTVVTFSPHPHEYFSGVSRPLLTPVAEKTWQLAQLGIDQLIMLPFNQALSELSPADFVKKVLIKGLKAQKISVGSDFHFGKGRSGNAQQLTDIAAEQGIPVVQVPLKYEQGDRISSSRIREALRLGQPEIAARLLGRPYILTGRVITGQQLGRTIGFPTANLQVPKNKYLPRTGVYSVRVYGLTTHALQGVMNIGNRPTVQATVQGQTLSIEVHILDWAGDLYQKMLTVSLDNFIRPEQKFDSLDQLKAQIVKDCQQARLYPKGF